MRRAAKVDENHNAVVDAFRAKGWSVVSLAAVGCGVHDVLVGRPGINVLIEIKDGLKVTSARKLTKAQVQFHRDWAGPQDIVCSPEEADRAAKFWHDRAMSVHSRDSRDRSSESEVPNGGG